LSRGRTDDAARDGGAKTPFTRRSLTLVELLVSVTILVLLAGALLTAGRAVQNSLRRGGAEARLKVLAEAMECYVRAWPPWLAPDGSVAADRAWPNWSAWRVFDTTAGFATVGGYNDAATRTRDPSDDDAPFDGDDRDPASPRYDVVVAGETLLYALMASSLGRTCFDAETHRDLLRVREAASVLPAAVSYPLPTGVTDRYRFRRMLVDPWGRPYRFLWVVRDVRSYSGWRAITSADSADGATPANVPPDPAAVFFSRAEGFVLESAGLDGRYGNVWRPIPGTPAQQDSHRDVLNAQDNILIRP